MLCSSYGSSRVPRLSSRVAFVDSRVLYKAAVMDVVSANVHQFYWHIWYASKKMTPTFGTLFRNAFAAQLPPQIGRLLPQIGRLLPGIEGFFRRSGRLSSEEAEGFFQRALGLNTHKFQKCGAASLTDLPVLRLHLPELCLCLPSRVNNGKAEQQRKGFCKCASFLKTRTIP